MHTICGLVLSFSGRPLACRHCSNISTVSLFMIKGVEIYTYVGLKSNYRSKRYRRDVPRFAIKAPAGSSSRGNARNPVKKWGELSNAYAAGVDECDWTPVLFRWLRQTCSLQDVCTFMQHNQRSSFNVVIST
jgi:hypothetical protein